MGTDVQWRTSLLVYAEPWRNSARMHLNAMENQAMKKRGERLYGNGELPYKFHFYTPLDSNDQQLNCKKDPKKMEDLCGF
ncbi:MAG: hypothetical protein ACYC4A_04000 [Desulfobulbia bacterium]